jgi:hypothetical protein
MRLAAFVPVFSAPFVLVFNGQCEGRRPGQEGHECACRCLDMAALIVLHKDAPNALLIDTAMDAIPPPRVAPEKAYQTAWPGSLPRGSATGGAHADTMPPPEGWIAEQSPASLRDGLTARLRPFVTRRPSPIWIG